MDTETEIKRIRKQGKSDLILGSAISLMLSGVGFLIAAMPTLRWVLYILGGLYLLAFVVLLCYWQRCNEGLAPINDSQSKKEDRC